MHIIFILLISLVIIIYVRSTKTKSLSLSNTKEGYTNTKEGYTNTKEGYTNPEVDLKISTAADPVMKNGETLSNLLSKVDQEVAKTKDETGMTSNKYDVITAQLNDTIAKNSDAMVRLSSQVEGAKHSMMQEVTSFSEQLNKFHTPVILESEDQINKYVQGKGVDNKSNETIQADMKTVTPGTFFLATGEGQADKYWDGTKLHDIEGRPIKKEIVEIAYPVGSVMIRFDSKDPKSLPGFEHTQWQAFEGDYVLTTTDKRPEVIGGSWITKAFKLTLEHLPSHAHTGTTEQAGEHTHKGTADALAEKDNPKRKTDDKTSAHTHTGKTNADGQHQHKYDKPNFRGNGGAWGSSRQVLDWWSNNVRTGGDGKHSHNFTTNRDGIHKHTVNIQHSHNLDIEESGKHSHAFTTSAVGGGKEHSHEIELPRINCKVWRRIS